MEEATIAELPHKISREEIIEGMLEERSAIGLIITMNSTGAYNVELLTQPYTKPTLARYIEIDLEDLLALITPPYDFYSRQISIRAIPRWPIR